MSINATLATAVRSLLSSESKQPSRTKL
jgi:hypothetical protein